MTRSPARRKDLEAIVTLVLGALLVSLLPLADWAKTALLLPVVLVAPGYAIGAALFRPGELPREYRVVLSVALSISAFALGGLLVQLVLPLNRLVLACLLALITIGASRVAFHRRQTAPLNWAEPPPLRLATVNPMAVVAVAGAIAVAVWAIETATRGAHDQLDESHFTSVWIVPPTQAGTPGAMRIGVSNQEGRASAYRLQVSRGADVLQRWRFQLDADQQWQATLAASLSASSDGRPLIGRLYRDGTVERSVILEIGGRS
jgi:uncharacterized membrane protein